MIINYSYKAGLILTTLTLVSCISGRNERFVNSRMQPEIICNIIVSASQPWLGAPYKFGGSTMEGVDCSGFVQNIYRQVFDIQLPRTTQEMFNEGIFIRGTSLLCGDLVFFNNILGRGGVDHVGIFIGNDRFIHASSTQGVTISELSSDYYTGHFISARRIQ